MIRSVVTHWRVISTFNLHLDRFFCQVPDRVRSPQLPAYSAFVEYESGRVRQFDDRPPDAQDPDFLPAAAVLSLSFSVSVSLSFSLCFSPRTTLIYEVRGKTRGYPRVRAHGPQSPPMGPDLTDAPDRLAGRAQICILSGRTTRRIG